MSYRKWTPEDDQAMRELRAYGKTFIQIAEALGRAPSATHRRWQVINGSTRKLDRSCSECPAPISDTNRLGKCKRCLLKAQNADKEFTAKRVAALLAHPAMQPGAPQRKLAGRKSAIKRLANPEYRDWLACFMRDVVQPKSQVPEVRAKQAQSSSERQMAWCPPEYRDLYRSLKRKGIPMHEARKAVIDQAAHDLRHLSPFERQQRALERGAKLVANDTAPTLSNPANYGEERWSYGR